MSNTICQASAGRGRARRNPTDRLGASEGGCYCYAAHESNDAGHSRQIGMRFLQVHLPDVHCRQRITLVFTSASTERPSIRPPRLHRRRGHRRPPVRGLAGRPGSPGEELLQEGVLRGTTEAPRPAPRPHRPAVPGAVGLRLQDGRRFTTTASADDIRIRHCAGGMRPTFAFLSPPARPDRDDLLDGCSPGQWRLVGATAIQR